MRLFNFDEKRNILYINTDVLLGDMSGMTYKEKKQYITNNFKMSYKERINNIKNVRYRDAILTELLKHKDCEISEFCDL